MTPAGKRTTKVWLYETTTAANSDGGFTETLVALSPASAMASVAPPDLRSLQREQLTGNTITSSAVSEVTLPYHPGLTSKSEIRILEEDRRLMVLSVRHTNGRDPRGQTVAICVEQTA